MNIRKVLSQVTAYGYNEKTTDGVHRILLIVFDVILRMLGLILQSQGV